MPHTELGERRVVRVEEDGARTPLVRGATDAWDVLYVPTLRDLLFVASEKEGEGGRPTTVRALWRIDRIPPLPMSQSRAAHFGTTEDEDEDEDERTIDVLCRVWNAEEGDFVTGSASRRNVLLCLLRWAGDEERRRHVHRMPAAGSSG